MNLAITSYRTVPRGSSFVVCVYVLMAVCAFASTTLFIFQLGGRVGRWQRGAVRKGRKLEGGAMHIEPHRRIVLYVYVHAYTVHTQVLHTRYRGDRTYFPCTHHLLYKSSFGPTLPVYYSQGKLNIQYFSLSMITVPCRYSANNSISKKNNSCKLSILWGIDIIIWM